MKKTFEEVKTKALKLISIKLRCKSELKDKLKDYDEDIVNDVINLLEKNGYLNESLYISAFIHDKVMFTNYGEKKIVNMLYELDLNKDLIEEEIELIDNDVWIKKIDSIINKKIKSNKNLSKYMLFKKIKNDLLTLGYPSSLINTRLDLIEYNDLEVLEYLIRYKNIDKNKLYKKGFKYDDIKKFE